MVLCYHWHQRKANSWVNENSTWLKDAPGLKACKKSKKYEWFIEDQWITFRHVKTDSLQQLVNGSSGVERFEPWENCETVQCSISMAINETEDTALWRDEEETAFSRFEEFAPSVLGIAWIQVHRISDDLEDSDHEVLPCIENGLISTACVSTWIQNEAFWYYSIYPIFRAQIPKLAERSIAACINRTMIHWTYFYWLMPLIHTDETCLLLISYLSVALSGVQ